MPESTAVTLEAFSLGYASVCCFFYGLLGVATVCTTTCTSSDGDEYSKNIKITPLLASFYCSIVILLGYFLWKFRYSTEAVGGYVQNTSFHLSTLSTQGHQHLTMSIRLAFSLILVFIIVIVIARNILLKPLTQGCGGNFADTTSCCTSLPQEQNPMMFSIRTTLKRLEPWIVGSGFAFLLVSLAFNWKEKTTFEKEAHKKVYGEEPPTVRADPVVAQAAPQGVQLKAGVEAKPAAAKPAAASAPSVSQAQQASAPAQLESAPAATNPKYEQVPSGGGRSAGAGSTGAGSARAGVSSGGGSAGGGSSASSTTASGTATSSGGSGGGTAAPAHTPTTSSVGGPATRGRGVASSRSRLTRPSFKLGTGTATSKPAPAAKTAAKPAPTSASAKMATSLRSRRTPRR